MIATINLLKDVITKWRFGPTMTPTLPEHTISIEDAITLRCEIDRLDQEIDTIKHLLDMQQEELQMLRGIASAADHIWDGRRARDRLAMLIMEWKTRHNKYQHGKSS